MYFKRIYFTISSSSKFAEGDSEICKKNIYKQTLILKICSFGYLEAYAYLTFFVCKQTLPSLVYSEI